MVQPTEIPHPALSQWERGKSSQLITARNEVRDDLNFKVKSCVKYEIGLLRMSNIRQQEGDSHPILAIIARDY